MRTTTKTTNITRRLTAVALISISVAGRGASAGPADITISVAPALGTDAPAGAAIKGNNAAVSSQTGALQYSFPITVAPGRNGVQPNLALSYSSQAPIYGGIAAGWTLEMPEIRLDTSRARFRWSGMQSDLDDTSNGFDPRQNDRFVSTMAGGRPLIRVNDSKASGVYDTYRALNDASFTRYDRMPISGVVGAYPWRARTTDGTTYLFGENNHMNCMAPSYMSGFAPLTSMTDVFGNTVNYNYTQVGGNDECRIDYITYGGNVAASVADFIGVKFNWGDAARCSNLLGTAVTVPAIGSQSDFRGLAPEYRGVRPLNSVQVFTGLDNGSITTINATTSPRHVRTVAMTYATPGAVPSTPGLATCNGSFSPYRELVAINESAVKADGSAVALPPVTFAYGSAAINRVPTTAVTIPSGTTSGATSLMDGKRYSRTWGIDYWPEVTGMYLDFDGDGRPDRLEMSNAGNECVVNWRRNTAQGWVTQSPFTLPRLPWKNGSTKGDPAYERCSLNSQRTLAINHTEPNGCIGASEGSYLAYRWMDMNGDGRPDLVTAIHHDLDQYDPNVSPPFGAISCTGNEGAGGCEVYHSNLMASLRICDGTCNLNSSVLKNAEQLIGQTELADCGRLVSSKAHSAEQELDVSPAGPGLGNCVAIDDPDARFLCYLDEPPPSAPPPPPVYPPDVCGNRPRVPYTKCNRYPWWIYRNLGNGQLGPAQLKLSEIQLESDYGDSTVVGAPSGNRLSFDDFDGDGFPDATMVIHANLGGKVNQPPFWKLMLGDGAGGLLHRWGTHDYAFGTPHALDISSMTTASGSSALYQTDLTIDFNGDGLRDHLATYQGWTDTLWQQYGGGDMSVGFNDGTTFYANGASASGITLPPANATQFTLSPTAVVCQAHDFGCWFDSLGSRLHLSRMLDIDADGRPDLVQSSAGAYVARFNIGGMLANTSTPVDTAVQNKLVADSYGYLVPPTPWPPRSFANWHVDSDFMDLNGDGISEAVSLNGSSLAVKSYDPAGHPPRLLYQISNGRGATTSAIYSSMSGTAVEQHPELGKAMPGTMWVVASLTTSDVFANTSSTSSTYYKNPVYNQEPNFAGEPTTSGKWSFRGFEEVTTTGPTGAKTIQRYGYGNGNPLSPDWSGRLVTTVVVPAEASPWTVTPSEVRTISETKWIAMVSSGGYISTYHPSSESKWTCKNGDNEAACRANPAAYSKTTSTYSGYPSSDAYASVWAVSSTTLQNNPAVGSATLAVGDKQRNSTFFLVDTLLPFSRYLLRPASATSFVQFSSGLVQTGKSETIWSEATTPDQYKNLAPSRQRTYFDATTYGESRAVYDFLTGNVIETWKPVQNAAATTKTTLTYDALKLFVTGETNEKGQLIEKVYDYATGAVTKTMGPNVRSCTVNCFGPVKEESSAEIDAMGRTLKSYVSLSGQGDNYTVVLNAKMTYVDIPTLSGTLVPTSMTTEKLIDPSLNNFTKDRADYDGSARLMRTTKFALGAAAADAITSYLYGNDGKLISVSTPDPSANDVSVVTTLYDFDSIGRPTKVRMPDHTDPAQRSAVTLAYNGVSSTTTEVLRASDGVPSVKVTTVDSFGRLIKVSEQKTGGATPVWVDSLYTYDGNDNVATMTDPQGGTTTLIHDWGGRRREIVRKAPSDPTAGKHWLYTYDSNGNLLTEQVPGANINGTDALLFTNQTTYDDLDRPATKTLGQRALTPGDQSLFANRLYKNTWDFGPNHVGRLTYVEVFAPGATATSQVFEYGNDAQGQRSNINETINIAGFGAMSRSFNQGFSPNVGPLITRYRDTFGSSETWATTVYDARGLPLRLELARTGSTTQVIAAQTRNVAGLVTKRRTDQLAATGSMPYIESNWTYDKLGRPLSQVVQKGAGTVQVAKQELSYFGNSDPKQLIHTLGASNAKTFNFTFDTRHQLTNVATTNSSFTGGYVFGNAGRLTRATVAANTTLPGSDVKPRDVNYVYGTGAGDGPLGVDHEAVKQLTIASGVGVGGVYASYAYDSAGNQTSRDYVASNEHWDYVYDGEDNLRRVTKKISGVVTGSEEYWYDSEGARLAIIYRDAAGMKTGLRWFIGETEAYYVASGVGANTATLSKVYAHPSLGTPVARIERTGPLATDAKIEYQFHGLGSNTLAAVASDGTVNASFVYAPYGEVVEATDGGAPAGAGKDKHRRRVTDKYVDEIGGLMYFGARYYDGVLLGWTQGDPLYRFAPDAAWTEPRRANAYQYVLGNPVSYVDPDGRDGLTLDDWRNAGIATSTTIGTIVALPELITIGTAVTVAATIDRVTGGPLPSPDEMREFLRQQAVQLAKEAAWNAGCEVVRAQLGANEGRLCDQVHAAYDIGKMLNHVYAAKSLGSGGQGPTGGTGGAGAGGTTGAGGTGGAPPPVAVTGTPKQAQRIVNKGNGPSGITRIDKPDPRYPHTQWEAHVGGEGSPALLKDGTWKHVPAGAAAPKLPKATLEWLAKHGWTMPGTPAPSTPTPKP
jgi:RHS repeat-associated protein